jgi:hypothetical protein
MGLKALRPLIVRLVRGCACLFPIRNTVLSCRIRLACAAAAEPLDPSTPPAAQRPGTMLRGRDFDATANNSVGGDRDASGIATYRGISLRAVYAPSPPKPAIHEV